MKIHKRILNLSFWIALITIIFIPGKVYTEGSARTEFGFPIRFFTQYHTDMNESSNWFISGVKIDLLNYFFNVLIIYGVIHVLLYLKNRLKLTKNK